MDIFGTVASAIDLSQKVLTYLAEYKDASKDRDLIVKEVNAIASLLPTLQGHLERVLRDGSTTSPTVAALSTLLVECKKILEELEKTLSKASEKINKLVTKLLWPFKKADLEQQIQKLTRIKSYLKEAVEYGTM